MASALHLAQRQAFGVLAGEELLVRAQARRPVRTSGSG